MKILLLSAGGGGGNILRSVKALFDRDVAAAQQTDPAYAARLGAAIVTRFLDTNEFSLADIAPAERVLIGAGTTRRLGARHNPDVARHALEESKSDVDALIGAHSVIVLIGTGGKGTGAGTIFPLAQLARQQKKLVLPIFVRPSFERHEVDKRRYDHALAVTRQFDAAQIRLVEILNDRGYDDANPQAQWTVWERMNLPIARALRGLVYVLWDLSQVDPSDLSALMAGPGRLRVGFGGLDPGDGVDPTEDQIRQAVQDCWANRYYAFSKPAGTSLVCIQGDWSNVADARIKAGLAASAAGAGGGHAYTPLYTRVTQSPKPWGVTALVGEHTGAHAPLDIEGSLEAAHFRVVERRPTVLEFIPIARPEPEPEPVPGPALDPEPAPVDAPPAIPAPRFATIWEFALAVNRGDPAAIAVAGNGATITLPMNGAEVRKLLGTVWCRGVLPRLSEEWRTRLLDALVHDVVIPNHLVRVGRRPMPLGDLTLVQLQALSGSSSVPDVVHPDLDLLVTVGRFWGAESLKRLQFTEPRESPQPPGRFTSLLEGLRG